MLEYSTGKSLARSLLLPRNNKGHGALVQYAIHKGLIDETLEFLGLVMSLCLPLHLGTKLQGVTCVDVELEDIFFNVTYYHQGIDAYGFIIDSQGRTILHPLLPKPTDRWQHPKYIDIFTLENFPGVHEVIKSMKR